MIQVGIIDPYRTERIRELVLELEDAGYFCVNYSTYNAAAEKVSQKDTDADVPGRCVSRPRRVESVAGIVGV